MARPKSKDPRTETMKFRATPGEQARIRLRAVAAGLDVGTFMRVRALGEKPRGLERPEPEAKRPPEDPVAALAVGVEKQEVADEIAEAQLDDPTAREAFIARRAQQFHGQGKTMPVARALASEEWANR